MEILFIMLFGVCIGSFLNVAILRLPLGQSIHLPASHCPKCLEPLKWYHNVPLFSWLALRGKCAFCKAPISIQYPLVEFATAVLYALCFVKIHSFTQALIVGSVFALLLALSIIDLRYKAVPDALSLPALLIAFCIHLPLESLQNGLLMMGALSFLRYSISALAKKEVMGEADSIVAGIMGAMLGIKLALVAIYISAVIALVAFVIVRKKELALPFIPFLFVGLLITWFFDLPILHVMELYL